jgi:hypothetical protein
MQHAAHRGDRIFFVATPHEDFVAHSVGRVDNHLMAV